MFLCFGFSSALLAAYDISLCAGLLPWIMLVIVRQLTILHGGLDSFSFWFPLCGGGPVK